MDRMYLTIGEGYFYSALGSDLTVAIDCFLSHSTKTFKLGIRYEKIAIDFGLGSGFFWILLVSYINNNWLVIIYSQYARKGDDD